MKQFVNENRTHFLSLLLIGLLLIPLFVISPVWAPQIFAYDGVFGGRMSVVAFCTCTVGHVISVGPPRPGRFHFVPGKSKLFEYKKITSDGVWVLGTHTGSSPCLKQVGPICLPISHKGDIDLVGTSR